MKKLIFAAIFSIISFALNATTIMGIEYHKQPENYLPFMEDMGFDNIEMLGEDSALTRYKTTYKGSDCLVRMSTDDYKVYAIQFIFMPEDKDIDNIVGAIKFLTKEYSGWEASESEVFENYFINIENGVAVQCAEDYACIVITYFHHDLLEKNAD